MSPTLQLKTELEAKPAALADSASDATLVQRAATGDRDAISAIWAKYRGMVRSILVSTLGHDDEIDDLVQEVFLGLFSAVAQTRDGTALPAILSRIAVRRAGMTLRKRRVRALTFFLPWTHLPEVEVWPPDVDDRLALAALHRVFDRIRPRPRLAFLLHHLEGMAYTDVADALGVSLPTAKRAIAEGRRRVLLLSRKEPRLIRFLPPPEEAAP